MFDDDLAPAFVAARTDVTGKLDQAFGDNGVSIVGMDPSTIHADANALTLQSGQPVIVGSNSFLSDANELLIRATVVRLTADPVFSDGFEPSPLTVVTLP